MIKSAISYVSLSAFATDRLPRFQIRPKVIAKTWEKADFGACLRPTKMTPSGTSGTGVGEERISAGSDVSCFEVAS